MKKGKLNKVETTYIEAKVAQLTPEQIAADLDRSVESVNKVIGTLKPVEVVPVPEPERVVLPPSQVRTMFQQNGGAQKITVMTGAITEFLDETREKRIQGSPRFKHNITKAFPG